MVVCARSAEYLYQCNGELPPDKADQIRFLERKLALAFRTNLTRYIHDLYLCVHRGRADVETTI
jgi:ABC-type uncharacterized transport system fused permease/ATPase subunit